MMSLKEKIDPKHTALLVIDIQNDFASPDKKYFRAGRGGDLSMVGPMIDKLEQIIPIACSAGVFVVYTQQVFDPLKLNELQKEQYETDEKLVTCDISTGGADFYRIKPPKERVYQKYNFNIFSNQDLAKDLNKNNIKTLVVTGMDIVYCVETAIRNGFDLGYKIVVPEDMVAGNAKANDLNEKTLELVRKTYGVVTDFAKLKDIWSNTD